MPTYLPLIGLFFTVISVLVAAIYVARSTINKETVREQKELVEAQANRLTFQEKRIDALEVENDLLKDRIRALEETKHELYEQVKSLPAFASMADEMVQIGKKMERMMDALTRMADRMERNGG